MINTKTTLHIFFGIFLTVTTNLSCPRRVGRIPQPATAKQLPSSITSKSYADAARYKRAPKLPPITENPESETEKDDEDASTASAGTSVPASPEAEIDKEVACLLTDECKKTRAANKIQSTARRFLAIRNEQRIREANDWHAFCAKTLTTLPKLPMPLVPKREESSFGYGKQNGFVDTLFHAHVNIQDAIAYQVHFCTTQLAYCYNNDQLDEYNYWNGYFYGITEMANLASLCYQKGYSSTLSTTEAKAQFKAEFEAIRMGYQWDGYAYYQSKIYADDVWADRPENQQYKRTAKDGSIYYHVPEDKYYDWALRPDNKEMRDETYVRLLMCFTHGLYNRPE